VSLRSIALVVCLVVTVIATAHAQTPATASPPGQDVDALAKATQNPVADLTAVPLQFNFNTGGDYGAHTGMTLNFQPVIPFTVNASWKVIARTVVPIDSFPSGDETRQSGIGDIQEQLYFTPATPGKIIWGVGPMLSLPTATLPAAETGSWAIGPGAVVVKNAGPWVLGGLIQQFWTFADNGGDPEIDLFVVQPFINYNFGRGWALAFAPLMTANWNASSGDEWTVPLGLGLSRTTVFNGRPMSLSAQYYYNVARPEGASSQQLRFLVSFLYPRTK
jgi:hypothetical protein